METEIIQKKKHPLFKWLLVIGIMVVANLFINFALDAFYPAPQYETFCPNPQVRESVISKDVCIEKGGQWSEFQNYNYKTDPTISEVPVPMIETKGGCYENYTCQKNYDVVRKIYNRNIFIALIIAGTILLIGGTFLAKIEAVALGFSFAGVLSFIIGTMRYWDSMDKRFQVVVLGIALVALVWLGVKKFRD